MIVTDKGQTFHKKSQMIRKPTFMILMAVLIFLGLIFLKVTWDTSIKATQDEAIKLALAAGSGIQASALSELNADISDLQRNQYKELKTSLIQLVSERNKIRFAYIFVQKNDKMYFLADSEPETSKDYSPPGQEYQEVSEQDFLPFQNGKAQLTNPITDRWGKWICVFVPIKNLSGDTIAVFAVDYPAESWHNLAIVRTMQAGFVVLCVISLFIALYIAFSQNKELRDEKQKLHNANAKIKENELLFRTIFDQAPIGIAIGHNDSLIIASSEEKPSINPMFEKILGRTKTELSSISWNTITHPEDVSKDLEYFQKFKSNQIDGYDLEKRFIKPDGSNVWVHMTIVPLQINSSREYNHLCLIEEISDRKDMEKALHDSERSMAVLLDNLPGMAYCCQFDPKWTMQFVSQGCFELTGYHAKSLLNNEECSFNDLIHPNYRKHIWDKWADVLEKHSKFKEEYPVFTTSGEMKWVIEQGQGVYDEEGNVLALEGMIIDITDRKKQEIEIKYINEHDHMTGLYNRRYFDEAMKDLDAKGCLPLSVMIGNLNGVRLINDAFGHEQGDILIQETAKIITSCCSPSDIIARTGGDEFSVLFLNTDRKSAMEITHKIKDACEIYNENNQAKPYALNISLGCSTKNTAEETIFTAYKDADEYMHKRKLLERKSSHGSIMTSIMATMFAKSEETEEHAERLFNISKKIGEKMGLPQESLDLLQLFSILHDVGKIGIDDRILNKPGKLDDEEWTIMKKHPEIGYRIAMASLELEPIAEFILTHHERWDGKGYPQGLNGYETPLLSRILAVADAYDAMTEDRVYRKAMPKEEAIKEIQRNAGTQFDPKVVLAFEETILENEFAYL